MLKPIFEIGKILKSQNPINVVLDAIDNVEYVIIIKFDENLKYIGITYEEFKEEKEYKYLYRRKGNSQTDKGVFTPTIVKSKNNLKGLNFLDSTKEIFGKEISDKKTIMDDIEKTVKLIKNNNKDKNKDKKVLLTITVNNKYLGEMPDVVTKLKSNIANWYETREGGEGICFLCPDEDKKVKKVIGDYFPVTFYTVDNPAYAPDLNKKLAYKHMPVCKDCMEIIKMGFVALEKYFKFIFIKKQENIKKQKNQAMASKKHFLDYYFIPYVNEENMKCLIDFFKNNKMQFELGRESYTPEDINDSLKKKCNINDSIRIWFLFLQKQQNSTHILCVINDVFPSRLDYIYKIKEEMEEAFLLKNDYFYSAIYNFYSAIYRLSTNDHSLFTLLKAIFLGKPIEPTDILLDGFRTKKNDNEEKIEEKPGDKFREKFKNACYDVAITYLFLKQAMEDEVMEKNENQNGSQDKKDKIKKLKEQIGKKDFVSFFKEYFDDDPTLYGLAILGFLVGYMEKIQYVNNFTPDLYLLFKEFSLDWDGVDELIRELVNKATKYNLGKEEFYEPLSEANIWLAPNLRENKSINEINLALCVGYGFGKKFI
ncbi:MAG: TM1802 family CRISPR-associated protein [Candidatus Aenigmatarchaeota archaeon]